MPYNAEKNGFGISGKIENVGEAVGDWRTNKKNYERKFRLLEEKLWKVK